MKEKIGYTDTALPSGLTAHRIKIDEMHRESAMWRPPQGIYSDNVNRIINENKCVDSHWGNKILRVVEQKAVWVADRVPNDDPPLPLGVAYLAYPGTPYEVNCIDINKPLVIKTDSAILRAKRSRPALNWPANVPATVHTRISEVIKRIITHEVGHCIGLAHPFDPLPRLPGYRPRPYERVRYHDRAFYMRDPATCWEEGDIKKQTRGAHDAYGCGDNHLLWNSGSTIMDYGSERKKERYRNAHTLGLDEANYLALLEQALTYTSPLHDPEFLFVLPKALELHNARPKPDRKQKPQWLLPQSTDKDKKRKRTTTDTTRDVNRRVNTNPDDTNTGDGTGSDGTGSDGTGGDGTGDGTEPTGTPPGPPERFAGYGTNGGAVLWWYPPTNSGTSPVTGYQYSVNDAITSPGGGNWTDWADLTSLRKARSGFYLKAMDGLTNGTTYGYRVRAVSDAGEGAASPTVRVTPTAPRRHPGMPVSFSASNDNGDVLLAWRAPSNRGNPELTHYAYRYATGTGANKSAWPNWTRISSGSSGTRDSEVTSHRVESLTSGVVHHFQVVAVNAVGIGTLTTAVRVTPTAPRPPVVALPLTTSISLNATAVSSTGFNIDIIFSRAVNGFEKSDISVVNGSVTSLTTTDNRRYTARILQSITDGEVKFSVPANVAQDAAGIQNTASTEKKVVIRTRPSITLSTSTTQTTGGFSFTVETNKRIRGLTRSDFEVSNGYISSFGGDGSDRSFAASVNSRISNGIITVRVPANVAEDTSGNLNTASNTISVTVKRPVDRVRPSVTLAKTSDLTSTGFDISITFSESVSGFLGSTDLSVTNGTVNSASGIGRSYSARIRPSITSGTVSVSVAANVAQDAANNGNTASNTISVTITPPPNPPDTTPNPPDTTPNPPADTTRPTVTLAKTSDLTSTGFNISITFSESVSGFSGSTDLSVTNGSVSSSSGSGSSYSARIRPSITSGTVSVSVAANVAQDAANNGNTASNTISLTITPPADTTRPSVTLSTSTTQTAGGFWLTITANEPIRGLSSSDFSVTNGYISSFAGNGTGKRFTATVNRNSSVRSGTITVKLPENMAEDAAGNGNTASNTVSVTINIPVDNVRPTVSLAKTSNLTSTGFDISITFSESVSGFLGSTDLSVTNGTVSSASGVGRSYSARIRPTITSGTVSVSVAANVAQDIAGNRNTASNTISVTITPPPDTTRPTVSLSKTSDLTSTGFDISITFSESVSGFSGSTDLSVTNGSVSSSSGSGSSYSARIRPSITSGTVSVSVAANVAQDAANNGNTASNTISVTITPPPDTTAPTVSISTATNPPPRFIATITFSEPVSGFESGDILVGNGRVVDLNDPTDKRPYSATIQTAYTNNLVMITIEAGVAKDAAGNGNKLAFLSVSVSEPDTVPPEPLNVIAAAGNKLVWLIWNPPSSDGGSPILSYEYRYRQSGRSWNSWSSNGTSRSKVITGLTNEVTYNFEVRAVNAIGNGASASVSATPTNKRRPYAPTNLTATPGNGEVTLSWTAGNDGNTPITDYKYWYRENNTGSWQSGLTGSTSTTYTVTGLTNGTLYGFKVSAKNKIGTGSWSNTATATPVNITTPSAPQNLRATVGNGYVQLDWSAPSNNGGSDITDYQVNYSESDGPWSGWTSTGSTYPTKTISGLTNDTQYDFRVRAVNAAGAGSRTPTTSATPTAVQPPNNVTNLRASTGSATGTIKLSWRAPNRDGGATITHYEYIIRRRDGNRWEAWSSWTSTSSSSTSYTVTGLQSGDRYNFRVRARNRAGAGSQSGSATANAK